MIGRKKQKSHLRQTSRCLLRSVEALEQRRLLAAQIITPGDVTLGPPATFEVSYSVNDDAGNPDPDAKAVGIVLRMHYDSSEIAADLAAIRASDNFGATSIEDQPESEVSTDDNDPDTDRVINYVLQSPNFPAGQTLPVTLYVAAFNPVGGFNGSTQVNFTRVQQFDIPDFESTAATVDFAATPTPVLSVATANSDQDEGNAGNAAFTFTVARDGSTTGETTVQFAIAGTGTDPAEPEDFAGSVFPSGTVTFGDGESTQLITIDVVGDTNFESDESFLVTLSDASAGTMINTATAIGIIRNDDPMPVPALAIAALTPQPTEGDDGVANLTFNVTRSVVTTGSTTVQFDVTPDGAGSGAADGGDFVGGVFPTGTIEFADGDTVATITVPVAGDTIFEPDDRFVVTLSNASGGAEIITTTASGIIVNDDPAPVSTLAITANNVALNEGDDGTSTFAFTVSRGDVTNVETTVDFAVTGGNGSPATADDFFGGNLPGGTLTFAPGQTSQTIEIAVAGDTDVEPNETFVVTLSGASGGAVITTASASAMILNDDARTDPTIGAIANLSIDLESPQRAVTIEVSDAETDDGALTVTASSSDENVVTASGVTGTGAQRTVTLTGLAAGTADVTVQVTDADDDTAERTFGVTVTAPINNPPTVNDLSDVAINLGNSFAPISLSIGDDRTDAGALSVSIDSSNETVATAAVSGAGANRTITLTPVGVGSTTVTVTLIDGDGASASRTFVATINPAPNTAPTITGLNDLTATVGVVSPLRTATVGDAQTDAAALTLTGVSSDPAVAGVIVSGTGAQRNVQVTPVAAGSATVTLTVSDGEGGTASESFVVTVQPAVVTGDVTGPTITTIGDLRLTIGQNVPEIGFSIADDVSDAGAISVSVTSGNLALLPTPELIGTGRDRTLRLSPVAGATGSSLISLTVVDEAGNPTIRSFNFRVDPQPVSGRILTPPQVVRLHVIPGGNVASAILLRAVNDTTLSVVSLDNGGSVQILNESLSVIDSAGGGGSEADLAAGASYAILFPATADSAVYSIRSSAGFDLVTQFTGTNLLNPTDANGDGRTSALDALTIVNSLSVAGGSGEPVAAGAGRPGQFLDVNGDGRVSALDALRVINRLSQLDGAGEPGNTAEADSVAAVFAGGGWKYEDIDTTVPEALLHELTIAHKLVSPTTSDPRGTSALVVEAGPDGVAPTRPQGVEINFDTIEADLQDTNL